MVAILLTGLLSAGTAECTSAMKVDYPCSGVLLPADAAHLGLQCLQVEYPRVEARLKFCSRESENIVNYYSLIIEAEKEKSELLGLRIDALSEQVGPRPWWEGKSLWAGIGFAVGVSAAILITHAVNDGE